MLPLMKELSFLLRRTMVGAQRVCGVLYKRIIHAPVGNQFGAVKLAASHYTD
jgi:hypothetical protein